MTVTPADKVFITDEEARSYGHHPRCDGWLGFHTPAARKTGDLWTPTCSFGCAIRTVGSASTAKTAVSMASQTNHSWGGEEFCQGECKDWI